MNITFNDIEQAVNKLKKQNEENTIFGCKIQECSWLKGSEVIIKSGNRIYVSPDFSAPGGEIKIIEVPEIDLSLKILG